MDALFVLQQKTINDRSVLSGWCRKADAETAMTGNNFQIKSSQGRTSARKS